MKLQDLKREACESWGYLHTYHDGIVLAPETFDQATKRYGFDRRRKDSWVTIYADIFAKWLYDVTDDPALMLKLLSSPPLPVGSAVLDRFLMFEDGYQMVVDALAMVYDPNIPTCEELYGLSELLEQASNRRGADRDSIRFIGELAGACAAA